MTALCLPSTKHSGVVAAVGNTQGLAGSSSCPGIFPSMSHVQSDGCSGVWTSGSHHRQSGPRGRDRMKMVQCPQDPHWVQVQNSSWPCPTEAGMGGVRSCKTCPTPASLRVGVTLGNPPTPVVTFENLLRQGPPRRVTSCLGPSSCSQRAAGGCYTPAWCPQAEIFCGTGNAKPHASGPVESPVTVPMADPHHQLPSPPGS